MLPDSMLVVLSESPAPMLEVVVAAAAAAAAAAEVDGDTQRSIIGIAGRISTNCTSSSSLSLSDKIIIALLVLVEFCSELLMPPSLLLVARCCDMIFRFAQTHQVSFAQRVKIKCFFFSSAASRYVIIEGALIDNPIYFVQCSH